jgi:hypothetical protein
VVSPVGIRFAKSPRREACPVDGWAALGFTVTRFSPSGMLSGTPDLISKSVVPVIFEMLWHRNALAFHSKSGRWAPGQISRSGTCPPPSELLQPYKFVVWRL